MVPQARSDLLNAYFRDFGRKIPDLLCPEINVWNTMDYQGLWRYALSLDPVAAIPFWGIVWPGGRALARYILDNRKSFRGKKILDTGCGSGITSLAAAMAGAAVTGMDIDTDAIELAGETAKANRVRCVFIAADPFELSGQAAAGYDLIIAADLFYDSKISGKIITFLASMASQGVPNIYSDSGRAFAPKGGYTHITTVRTPQYRELDNISERDVMIRSLDAVSSMQG